MTMRKVLGIFSLILLFAGGLAGGYFYFSSMAPKEKVYENGVAPSPEMDLFSLRIYYPARDRLVAEERTLPRRTGETAIAEAAVEEFLKGTLSEPSSVIPKNARLLALYRGADEILYVDLSDEFKRNFSGDAVSEFFLLKGLYESIISNVGDVKDVKVLIEGREIETLGGHLNLSLPLKDIVSYADK